MGDVRINIRSLFTIGLIGFAGVWAINRALAAIGYSSWQA